VAAGKSDIEAGAAFVRLYTKGFDTVMGQFKQFGGVLVGLGASLSAIGAGIGVPLLGAVEHFIKTGAALDDMSHRTGIAREKLAQLEYVAAQVGIEMGSVEKAVKGMIKNGFDPADFDKIATEINSIENSALRAQRAMKVFGKAGFEILQLLEEWTDVKKRAEQLGIGLTDSDIRLADQLGDTLTETQAVLSNIYAKIGAALAPVLIPLAEAVTQIAAGVSKWVDKNRALVPIIAAVAAGLVVVGGLIAGIGVGLIAIAAVGSSLAAIVGAVGAPVLLVLAGLTAFGVGLAALAASWLTFTKTGQEFSRMWIEGVHEMLAEWDSVFASMRLTYSKLVDAVKAGDLKLAWEIGATGMKLAYLQAFAEIQAAAKEVAGTLGGGGIQFETNFEKNIKLAIDQTQSDLDAMQARTPAGSGKRPGDGRPPESILTGFNPLALLRAGQLNSFDPALAKADTQIDLMQRILDTLIKSYQKMNGPEVATA
jgi:hypothetical protein